MSESCAWGPEPRYVADWAALWREMVEARYGSQTAAGDSADVWADRAPSFDQHVKERWGRPDPTRDALISLLTPGATLVDIGAGPGTWAVPLAPHLRHVTAIEPSPAMAAILRANLADRGIQNVTVVRDRWPDAAVESHDFVLSSHAFYGVADLPAFVRAMVSVARWRCFLIVRCPVPGGIVAEAAQHIWGHPDAILGLGAVRHVLREMGIAADVLAVSEDELHRPTCAPAQAARQDAEAFALAKRWLAIPAGDTTHDRYLHNLIADGSSGRGGRPWPTRLGAALISWVCE